MNSISKLVLLLILAVSISACGLNKKKVSKAKSATENVAAVSGDITRPPEVEKDLNPLEEAVADGETVSFDEWRKRRQAAQQKQDE